MGLLDNLGNLSPEQTQGLLGFAANMLQAGGPSRMPIGFGQALGSGIQGFQSAMQAERQRKLEEDQARQIAEMRGLQIQGLAGDLQDKATARQQALDAQKLMRDFNLQRNTPTGRAQAILGNNLSPTIDNAAALSAAQQQPAGGDSTGNNTTSQFNERMALAQFMRSSGNPNLMAQADAQEQAALKFRPEFDQTPRVAVGPDGKPFTYVLSKDGAMKRLDGVLPRDEMKLADLGGKQMAYNPYQLTPGQSFDKTMTTADFVNMRGQNLVNERAKEANNISAQNNTISLSTGLRKEFDDLPEVKNYKQALPAYIAIKDAASRSTPQADINLVYAIAKLYDPNSVVREGEYDTVANSPSIPERVKGWVQFVNGGGRLSEGVKNQIMQEAAGRMQSFETPYLSARKNYENIAQQSGGISSMLFPSQYQSPIAAPKANTGKPAQASAPRSKIVKLDGGGSATGVLAADGNYYVQRNGKTYRVEED